MEALFAASIIAAFIAGMVALFAPCCITVLLPAYLGAAFREKKNILRMTFVFFAGIAAILIPIGLGAASLAQVFKDFHREMYILGGIFMLILAVMAIAGKGLAIIPMSKRLKPKLDVTHTKSVFVLGMFSGAATSCCAPVLAGAITLAVISGAFWKALIVTFAYIFGMTFPLFITAYFYDRYKLNESRLIQGKLLTLRLFGKSVHIHTTNLLSGIVFIAMGIILLVLGLSNNAFWAPTAQSKLGETLNQWSLGISNVLMRVPDVVWGIAIAIIFFVLLRKAFNARSST